MKYIFVFLLIGLVSCGDATADAGGKTELSTTDAAEQGTSSDEQEIPDAVSKEYASVKIGNLEIMTEDLGQMEWDEANEKCAELGNGWRFPTRDELNLLYQNKENIGGFDNYEYWSSEQKGAQNDAWVQFFGNGYQYTNDDAQTPNVRVVRTILKEQ